MPPNIFVWRPFPYAYFLLYFTLIISSLIIPPSPHRRLLFAPILVLTLRLLYDAQAGYLTSTLWFTCLIMASDYILLTDVQRELHQLPDSVDTRSPGITIRNIDKAPLKLRVKWAFQLFFNARGIGWAHEPRAAIPSRAPPNTLRINFIVRQLGCLCITFLLFDLANLHARWNPAFYMRTGMVSAGWRWRVTGTAAWAVAACSGMSMAHYTASILCVALGVSRPQDWPPLFGDLADAASVRTFWARGWHQIMRRSLCAHAKFISDTLRLPPRSPASVSVKICCAFALSGLVHYLGEAVPMGYGRSGSLIFFGIQPVAIALETLVTVLSQRVGVALPGLARKAVGWAWVLGWFVLTLPIMQDPLLQTGEMDSRMDASVIMGLWRGTWILPPGPSSITANA
ncbi:membrane bound O-acyl transferase family-domain-containing protein [Mycena capillaripes]|nr:membrane bound O-acyl transferase family-domain-containing protein [Mycena capillaripes]